MTRRKSTTRKGRPASGKERKEIVREAKARHRAKIKKEGKIHVTLPILEDTNAKFKNHAYKIGSSSTSIMVKVLEDHVIENQRGIALPNSENTLPILNPPKLKHNYERIKLFEAFKNKMEINQSLTRRLVSFQANKGVPFYRWIKYKEAFSSELVLYFLNHFKFNNYNRKLKLLDPFAGVGTALLTASKNNWETTGIDLLPVATTSIKAQVIANKINVELFSKRLHQFKNHNLFSEKSSYTFPHLKITERAFSNNTEIYISKFMSYLKRIKERDIHFLFWFACISILEEISYTRKDGQYLRWDYRSGRKLKSTFNKGAIPDFITSITKRLESFEADLLSRDTRTSTNNFTLIEGSCLEELSKLSKGTYDLILTSPPYCNRYDYTRTYALELAYLNNNEAKVKELRQALLSATVENKSKRQSLKDYYKKNRKSSLFRLIESTFETQKALHEVLNNLKTARENKELSNNNIPNLVENYFFEMTVVIFEFARILRKGGRIILVNDNVQYSGEEVPVDIILSDFAQSANLEVEKIWILPMGKGNSSQQMGKWGRQELRKCVYSWRKQT